MSEYELYDLIAQKHAYTLNALVRQRRETLEIAVGDTGNILINGGVDDGFILLTENGDTFQHDGDVRLVLAYKLGAQKHRYIMDALARQKRQPFDSLAVTVRVGPATATATPLDPAFTDYGVGYPWGFQWAYAATVPVKAFSSTGYAPTVTATYDDLLINGGVDDGDYLLQEIGDRILVDI